MISTPPTRARVLNSASQKSGALKNHLKLVRPTQPERSGDSSRYSRNEKYSVMASGTAIQMKSSRTEGVTISREARRVDCVDMGRSPITGAAPKRARPGTEGNWMAKGGNW